MPITQNSEPLSHRDRERPGPELAQFSRQFLEVLVHLEALMTAYHFAHVNAKGPSYYSDHLLLQRLYAGTGEDGTTTPLDEIDSVMEKWKGLLGPGAHLDAAAVADEVVRLLRGQHLLAGDKLLKWLLSTEHNLQYLLRDTLEKAPAAVGYEIDGVENLLQGIADRRQTNIYLLQQRLNGNAKEVSGFLAAEQGIWDGPDELPPSSPF